MEKEVNYMEKNQYYFERLFTESKNKLYSVAFNVVRNREMAEDVLQDAYIKAWNRFEDYNPDKKFVNWMTTIVRNTGIDAKRSNTRQVSAVSMDCVNNSSEKHNNKMTKDIVDKSQDLDKYLENKELYEEVYSLLEQLPADLRDVLLLLNDRKSYSEISEITNESVGTVRSRIHKAKKILRNSIQAKQISNF